MRMCRSRPLKPRKYRLPWPRLPWSGQVGLWQKKDSMGRPDGSVMAQALGVSTRRGNTRVRGILWNLFAQVGHHRDRGRETPKHPTRSSSSNRGARTDYVEDIDPHDCPCVAQQLSALLCTDL